MLLGTITWLQARMNQMRNERGATAIEYALMASLIAAVIIVFVQALGITVADIFDFIDTEISL